jgi:ATP-dependent DNA helicase
LNRPQILTPFLLRRVKADVDLKIPPKKEVLVYCPMTAKQHQLYEATVNKTIKDLLCKVGHLLFFI